MQDKALDVLSQQLRGDRDALAAHLPLILAAAAQPATSVRRRAVDILWECYIGCEAYCEGPDGARRAALLLVKCVHLYSGAPPRPTPCVCCWQCDLQPGMVWRD